jgi:hypothetical protein
MNSCNKNGECLIQCECECYNEQTGEYNELCTCSHREHNGYCPSNCCIPIECIGCKCKLPKWEADCHYNKCMNCAVQFGRHKITTTTDDCPICLENKNIIVLKCNHSVCNECWYNITKRGFGEDDYNPLCPICRNLNDWKK